MELIRGLHNLRARHRPSAVTIGNFDGMHLGHRAIIEQLVRRSQALGVKPTAVIFEPSPLEFFMRGVPPARLMSLRDKCRALAAAGAEQVLVARFDRPFSQLAPEAFIEQLLVKGLGARHVLVGDDFRFGRKRAGDIETLAGASKRYDFELADVPTVELDGQRVSSTRVRDALAKHDLQLAQRLLGSPYAISGRVRHGRKLGRTLGFPTVNLALWRRASPVSGVYVVRVHGVGYGAASVGTRPTVRGVEPLLEVHLLDFDGDLYGTHIEVEFLHRLRGEEAFPDVNIMREQIQNDVQHSRSWLHDNGLQPR